MDNDEYMYSKPFIKFVISNLSYINEESIRFGGENEKEYYKDLFIHYGSRYELNTFKNAEKLIFPFFIYETGEFCHLISYLHKILQNQPSSINSIVRELINNLELNKRYQTHYPKNSIKSLSSIIYLIKMILIKYPYFNLSDKKKLIWNLYPFISFPNPIGNYVSL